MTWKSFQTLSCCTLLAGAAIFLLGGPSSAAETKAPRDSASGQATGKREKGSGLATGRRTYEPIIIRKYEDIEATLASLKTQLDQLQTQCDELSSLCAEAQTAETEDSAAAADMLSQIDEAQKVFEDQIASLLDADVSAQVMQGLEESRRQLTATATFSDGSSSDTTDDARAVLDEMAALLGAFEGVKAAAAQGKTTQTTRSNIGNN